MPATAQPPASSAYVDFDEYVDFQLAKTQNSIKWTDIVTAAAVVGAFGVGYLLIFAILDHWVIPGGFSQSARFVLAGTLLAICTGWLAWKVLIPYLKQVSGLYAARTIELSEPGLKSTLLNLVDLRRSGRELPAEIRGALEKRAAQALSRIDVDQAVDRRPLMRAAYVLLGLVVLICLYSVFSPKKISFARAFIPPAQVGPATRTVILDVKTDPPLTRTAQREVDVVARTQLAVIVDVGGEMPEEVVLRYTTADRKYVNEPVVMRQEEEGLKQYRGVLNGENGRGILQDLTFHVVAGDDVSREYKVLVNQAPSAAVSSVKYAYPEYMELENRTRRGGNIDAWEGTVVTVSATVNQPVKTAVLQFFDDQTAETRAEEVRMEIIDGTKLRAEWPLKIRPDGTFARSYRIYCVTDDGQSDPAPTLYTQTIRPDRRPVVQLLEPRSDLRVPANAVIPLLIEARDPDFQLRTITLQSEKNGEEIFNKPLIFDGLQQEFRGTWEWHLEPMRLKAGDVVTYWIEATDNREPTGNVSQRRQLFELHIVDRVPQEEADRQLQADRERVENRLKEADQKENPEGRPQQPQQEEGQPQPKEGQPGKEGQPADNGQQEPQPGEPQPDKRQEGEGQGDKGNQPGENKKQPGKEGQQPADDEQKNGAEGQPGQSANDEGTQPPLDDKGRDDSEALRRLLEKHRQEQKQKQQQEQNQDKQGQKPGEAGEKQDATGPDKPGEQGNEPGAAAEQKPGEGRPEDKPPVKNSDGSGDRGDKPQPGEDPADGMPPGQEKSPQQKEGDQQKNNNGSDPMQGNNGGQPAGGAEGNEKQDKGGADNGKSPGQPSDANKSSKSNQPGGDPDNKQPGGDKPNPTDKPFDGQEMPTGDGSPGAQKKDATGDEQGPATGNDDPNADSTRAKNKLERKEGEKGATRPSQDPPDKNTERKQGDGTGSRNPDQAKPAPETKNGERNRNDAGDNPDKRPSEPRESDPRKPAARQDENADKGNEEIKGKGRPDGQRSEKPQGGEEGGGKPGDQGQKGGNKPGAGDSSGKPGMEQKTDKSQTGEPGGKPGEGSGKTEGDSKPGSGQQSGKPGDAAGGAPPSKSPGGEGQPSDAPGAGQPGGEPKTGDGNARGGDTQGPAGNGGSGGNGLAEAEKANMEYNKKAANLVLQELQDELDRGEADQELLDEFGWTKDDLQRYLDRMQKTLGEPPAEGAPQTEAQRRQVEEFLKGYNLRKGSSERDQSDGGIAPRRRPVPAEFREAYEAYTRSLQRKAANQ